MSISENENAMPQWKQLELELASLQGQSGQSAYRRITICLELYDNAEWREQHETILHEDAAAWMDEHLQDLCLGFAELRDLHEYFPNEADWKNGKLRSMHDRMMTEKYKPSTNVPAPIRTTNGKAAEPSDEKTATEATVPEAIRQSLQSRIVALEKELAKVKTERDEFRRQAAEYRKDRDRIKRQLDKLVKQLEAIPI